MVDGWRRAAAPACFSRLAVLRNLSPMLMVDTDVAGMIRLDLEPIA
jgi:hypothetical protein